MVQCTLTSDGPIRDCLEWIANNYACANPVTAMAERSALTSRTFARRFLAATSHRPIDYVQALRVERARALIESSGGRVDDVGFSVGYEDPTFFRRLFKRTTGLTPAAYRRKFAPIAGAHPPSVAVDGPQRVGLQ